jgi:uncharacterized protein
MVNSERSGPVRLGVVNIDSFTRLKQRAEGTVAPSRLPRLREVLVFPDGELNYRIEGHLLARPDGGQQRSVRCIITGWVTLQCQTTLRSLRQPLDINRRLVLVETEDELPALEEEPEDEDYVVARHELDLSGLLEDEVILDLPMIPRSADGSAEAQNEKDSTAESSSSPFAALAALKKPSS